MNCDKVKELLWAYLENKTTAEETAEIETHLEGCAACREELAQQKEIKNALASLPDEELPEDYHTELMQKLQAERKVVPFPAKKKHGWKQMSMIAAAVLVVVVAGGTRGMLEMRQNQNEEIEQILFEDTALMADTGEEAAEQTAADSATENNAADSMTLQVEKKETALQAIRKSIEEAGGYEESSADDVIQAVIPVANYADFLEQVGKLGEIQAFFQGEEDGASRTISISVTEK